MRRAIAFLGCTAIAAAACFYGVPDVDDRNGGGGGEGSDGSTSSDAAKLPDVANIDSGPDFCSTLSPKPYFCDDFDSLPNPASWGSISPVVQNQPSPMVDDGDFLSYPNSLHFSIAKDLPTTRLVLPVTFLTHLEITFDVKASGSPRSLAGFVYKSNNDEEDILVAAGPGIFGVIDEGIFTDGGTDTAVGHSSATVNLTNWVHVDLTINVTLQTDGGSSGTETLLVNGAPIDSNVPLGDFITANSTFVVLVGECQFSNACDVRFDNAVVNLTAL